MNETMGAIIARRRKELGMTQEQLAGALGISYQAVSKWENELSSPDISALPLLADTLGLTLDELFGRETAKREAETREEPEQIQEEPEMLIPVPAPVQGAGTELPWPDDDVLRAVLFIGRRPVKDEPAKGNRFTRQEIRLCIEGDVLNVKSDFDVLVQGEVHGSVEAGGDVDCDGIEGNVQAGGDVSCGDVGGSVSAGGDVDCDSVGGDVKAGGDVDCDDVGGSVCAAGDVDCDDVGGSVRAEGDVSIG